MSIAFEVPVGSQNEVCVSDDRLVVLVLRVVSCPYVAFSNEILIYVADSASMGNL